MPDETPPVVEVPVVPTVPTTQQRSDAVIPYVRATITLLLVGSLVAFYWARNWAPESLVTMGATAFGYYFGSRASQNGAKL